MKTNVNTITLPNNSKNVITKLKNLFFSLVVLFLIASCETNDDMDIDPVNPDIETMILGGIEFENSITEARENSVQNFTVSADSGGLIIGEQGTQIYFPPGGFEFLGGEAASGDVDIQLIEIYDRASMLKQQVPTNGQQANGDVVTILSGGEFFINATSNGNQLAPATDFTLTAPTDDFDPEMTVFIPRDCQDINCDVVWEEDEDAEVNGGEIQNEDGTWTSAYVAPLNGFGWTNLDKWWSYAGPKTMVYVDVPEGFDNTNSGVYVSYDGEPNALAYFDTYDETLEMFTEHYGQMPIGLEVHFIFVSVQNGDYVYAIQGATIVDGHTEVIGTTGVTTEAGITALINDLP